MAMKMDFGLTTLPPFETDVDHASLGLKWKAWRDRFDIYLDAAGVTSDKQKRALLLHLSGEGVQRVFRGLTDTGEDYKTACEKLDGYFLPKKNVRYERFVFKQAKQETNESLDQFVTRLKTLSRTCGFDNEDDAIADQILEKCASTSLKRRILRETDSTLKSIMDLGRAMERADSQLYGMQHGTTGMDKMTVSTISHSTRCTCNNSSSKPFHANACFNCGGVWPHPDQHPCPARGKTCNKCSKLNHFAKFCRSSSNGNNRISKSVEYKPQSKRNGNRWIHTVHGSSVNCTDSSDTEEEYVAVLSANNRHSYYGPRLVVSIAGVNVDVLIDSGASVNLIDSHTYKLIKDTNPDIRLKHSNARIYAYGAATPLQVLGKFETVAETRAQILLATFIVVNQGAGSLLGFKTATDLGLITIPDVNSFSTSNTQCSSQDLDNSLSEYSGIFYGTGKLKDYQFDEDTKPVMQPSRRIPFSTRQQGQTEIKRNKPVSPFTFQPETVLQRKGSMPIFRDARGKMHSRNSSRVKKFSPRQVIKCTSSRGTITDLDTDGDDWNSDSTEPVETRGELLQNVPPFQHHRYPTRIRFPP